MRTSTHMMPCPQATLPPFRRWPCAAAAVAVVLVGLAVPAEGGIRNMRFDQSDISEILPCVETLTPCQPEVKWWQVTAACCKPLSDLVVHNPGCICAMFFNSDLLDYFNLTRNHALEIAVECNIPVTMDYCNNYITQEQADEMHRLLAPSPFASILGPSSHPGAGRDGYGANRSPHNGLPSSALVIRVIISSMVFFIPMLK